MALQRGRGKATTKAAGLIITSLIDFFSIVVIYLMKSYSAEGNTMTNADNLTLPNSIASIKPKDVTVQVSATNEMIMVDNVAVVPTEDVRKIPQENGDPVVPKVKERLDAAYAQEQEMVRLGALNSVEGNVTIQVDKNMDFDVVYKLMNTCAAAKYVNMNFAVMKREE